MEKRIHTETLPNGLSFDMMYVEGGSFMMGGTGEAAYEDEGPIHQVALPSFYIGKYPVTQELWEILMKGNPSAFKGAANPVDTISWEGAHQFIKQLNLETHQFYRLPTEAEWEFAARGGINSEGYVYAGSDKLKEVGWYGLNAGDSTHSVGQKMGNELGIHDCSGNVYEWCEDDWHDSFRGSPNDGTAWIYSLPRGETRVVRGGSWYDAAHFCNLSYRDKARSMDHGSTVGFRLVLPLVQ